MNLIRKISVGPEYKYAMHFSVGQTLKNGYEITRIEKKDEGYFLYILNEDGEELPWKYWNNSQNVTIEFEQDFDEKS